MFEKIRELVKAGYTVTFTPDDSCFSDRNIRIRLHKNSTYAEHHVLAVQTAHVIYPEIAILREIDRLRKMIEEHDKGLSDVCSNTHSYGYSNVTSDGPRNEPRTDENHT